MPDPPDRSCHRSQLSCAEYGELLLPLRVFGSCRGEDDEPDTHQHRLQQECGGAASVGDEPRESTMGLGLLIELRGDVTGTSDGLDSVETGITRRRQVAA